MANQTIQSVPPSVDDPQILKRFLLNLVEQLDIVLGYRGDDPYVTASQVSTATTALTQTTQLAEGNTEAIASLQEQVTSLTTESEEQADELVGLQYTNVHQLLGAAYEDLDADDYFTLEGNGEFSADGADITNAPYTASGGTVYNNFINSVLTDNGGVAQRLLVQDGTNIAVYHRAGDTKAEVLAAGWI